MSVQGIHYCGLQWHQIIQSMWDMVTVPFYHGKAVVSMMSTTFWCRTMMMQMELKLIGNFVKEVNFNTSLHTFPWPFIIYAFKRFLFASKFPQQQNMMWQNMTHCLIQIVFVFFQNWICNCIGYEIELKSWLQFQPT